MYNPTDDRWTQDETTGLITKTTGIYPERLSTTTPVPAPSIPGRELYIPLDFWFCESGSALPLVALQNSVVEIEITFRPIKKLYVLDQSIQSSIVQLTTRGDEITIPGLSQTAEVEAYESFKELNPGINYEEPLPAVLGRVLQNLLLINRCMVHLKSLVQHKTHYIYSVL